MTDEVDRIFLCVDCGKDTRREEYYAVKDAVWVLSGLSTNGGMLCFGCLERRLGRRLTLADFEERHLTSRELWQRYDAARD